MPRNEVSETGRVLNPFRLLAETAFLFILFSGTALADRVVLHNGDFLTGTLLKLQDGKLLFKTDYAGPVEIEAAKIKSIVTGSPVEVHIVGGETLTGKLKTEGSDRLGVESGPGRETIVIDLRNVTAINPPLQAVWTGNVTLGGTLQSGNTDQASFSGAAEAERKSERQRIRLNFLYNYGEEEEQVSTRNTYGSGTYSFFFTKKTFGYVGLELLNDKFQNIKLRTIVGPGMGYQLLDNRRISLALEAGLSYFYDDLEQGEDTDYMTARLSFNLRYTLFKIIVLSDRLAYYPKLEEFNNYKLRNEAAIASPLGAEWALKLTNIMQYDNDPSPGVDKADLQWILGLQYKF